jgi:Uma2 family endonuclease
MNGLLKSMSLDEFLAWEERQELKWEYDGFAPRAMTGGTSAHALIQANLMGQMYIGLRGSPCRIYGSELKVRMQSTIRYPDALVVCSKIDARTTYTTDATVVFEVLSKSSAVFDLGVKSVEYRTLPSLKRYVVLHQTVAAAEVFQLDAEGAWTHDLVTASGALEMPEIGCAVALSDIYAGVEFPA